MICLDFRTPKPTMLTKNLFIKHLIVPLFLFLHPQFFVMRFLDKVHIESPQLIRLEKAKFESFPIM